MSSGLEREIAFTIEMGTESVTDRLVFDAGVVVVVAAGREDGGEDGAVLLVA